MRKLNSRSIHRYLSVVVGIQLLLWTTSGLIFSWNSIDKVRGENLIRKSTPVDLMIHELFTIREILDTNGIGTSKGEVVRVELRSLLDKAVYEVEFTIGESDKLQQILFDARTGTRLSPVTEELAAEIARRDFPEDVGVKSVELVETNPGSHSEYRGKELPVWRVSLDHPTGTVIYVSANRGLVTARRNNQWRLFDVFWMLHTMDYQGRDNFNSWLLRSFSVFGVTTVLSGYWLWWRTSWIRKRRIRLRSSTGSGQH
jgi:hypothetical protein